MAEPRKTPPFPRLPLFGAFALVLLSMMLAGLGRFTGMGAVTVQQTAALISQDLRFEDRSDGSVAVLNSRDGSIVEVLPPGTNGFVRGVLRGLARERKMHGIGDGPPFRLTSWADGRLSLEDTATGRRIELVSFGATQFDVFAKMLASASAPKRRIELSHAAEERK